MNFFIHFLKDPKAVAAIKPSSRFLAHAAVKAAELQKRSCVIELGSGTGVFTKYITPNLNKSSVFFAMETNSDFVKVSQEKNPGTDIYEASAEDIKEYLSKYNRETADCIISALPWATLYPSVQERILDAICDVVEEGGVFLTIANIQGLLMPSGREFRKTLERKFSSVGRTKIVWRNLMPSIVYVCEK